MALACQRVSSWVDAHLPSGLVATYQSIDLVGEDVE